MSTGTLPSEWTWRANAVFASDRSAGVASWALRPALRGSVDYMYFSHSRRLSGRRLGRWLMSKRERNAERSLRNSARVRSTGNARTLRTRRKITGCGWRGRDVKYDDRPRQPKPRHLTDNQMQTAPDRAAYGERAHAFYVHYVYLLTDDGWQVASRVRERRGEPFYLTEYESLVDVLVDHDRQPQSPEDVFDDLERKVTSLAEMERQGRGP